ncbi:MAG: ABC transporter ATP-binding protein, partial [Proteobacteria bacterium]|nr:ABC transporter ATP-binding protein [Pseudomonadota bacterium]
MNSAPTPVLQMQHVRKTYRLGEVSVHALRDIDLDF